MIKHNLKRIFVERQVGHGKWPCGQKDMLERDINCGMVKGQC